MTLAIALGILLAIFLGYITRINIGFYAIAFAYLLGAFGLGLDTSEIIDFWPINIFFVILTVTLFYGFAMVNGTLEKLAGHMLYSARRIPWALPLIIFAAATIIAALGAGFYTVVAFMAPMALLLSHKTGLSMVISAMAVNYGALAGANFMTSQSGVIFRSLMGNAGVESSEAFGISTAIFATTITIPIVVIGGYLVFFRKKLNIQIEPEKPEPFGRKQKQTLTLILALMSILLILPILHIILPENETIEFVNSKADISFMAMIFVIISLLLRLGDEKKVISSVPWNTLIMISGVGMLIQVAIEAGVIDQLAEWVSTNIPLLFIPVIMVVIGMLMSLFASTLGVVAPALFPVVPGIAAATGFSPMLLFVSIIVGAQASAISPFSSGGSLILGSAPKSINQTVLFNNILFKAVPIGVGAALLAGIAMQVILA